MNIRYVSFMFSLTIWLVCPIDYIHNYTAAHVMPVEEDDLTSIVDWNLLDLMTASCYLTNMESLTLATSVTGWCSGQLSPFIQVC